MLDFKQSSSEANLFRPVETKRASEAIFDQIKDLIMRGKLRPGDRLPSERSMIEMFQRSRPTIREALRMLERAGYIRTMAGSTGAVVLPPNDKNLENSLTDALSVGQISLKELAEYRTASEMSTAVWAAERRTAEDIKAMEELLDKMASRLDSLEQYSELDSPFHGLIAQAAKNSVSAVFNSTFSKLNRSFVLNKSASMGPAEQREMNLRVHRMHVAIFEAIRDGDADRAREATREHLAAFQEDLDEIVM